MKSKLSEIRILQAGQGDVSGLLTGTGIRTFGQAKSKRITTRRRTLRWSIFVFAVGISMIMTVNPLCGREIVDRVVAVVNNEVVSLYDLNQRVAPFIEKIKKAGGTLSEQDALIRKIREKQLNLLIDEKLADQEIRRLKIRVSKKQVDQALDRFRSSNGITMAQLESALADQGRSLESFRKEIKSQILRARLVNQEINSKVVITGEEVAAYYKSHPDEFGAKKKFRLKNIVMKVSGLQAEDGIDAILKKMEQIHERLVAGESFDVLAREYSQAPNAGDGGTLGDISVNILAPKIRRALEALHPGEFTDVIETDQGFQIFYLEAIDEKSAESFEKNKARIEDTLYNELVNKKYAEWLRDLRARALIKLIK